MKSLTLTFWVGEGGHLTKRVIKIESSLELDDLADKIVERIRHPDSGGLIIPKTWIQ